MGFFKHYHKKKSDKNHAHFFSFFSVAKHSL